MLMPKWWNPLIESALPSAIASSSTGNAQIRSKERDTNQSVLPPWKPASSARKTATKVQMSAEPMPILSELRPP